MVFWPEGSRKPVFCRSKWLRKTASDLFSYLSFGESSISRKHARALLPQAQRLKLFLNLLHSPSERDARCVLSLRSPSETPRLPLIFMRQPFCSSQSYIPSQRMTSVQPVTPAEASAAKRQTLTNQKTTEPDRSEPSALAGNASEKR